MPQAKTEEPADQWFSSWLTDVVRLVDEDVLHSAAIEETRSGEARYSIHF